MSFTTPLFVPLVKGLDLSKESTLGTDALTAAVNVDYTVDGQIRGRPGRAAKAQFVVRDPSQQVAFTSTNGSGSAYLSAANFTSTGFTPRGLMRLRDGSGERVALGCNGRLFTKESSTWMDRGPFHCTRVDRPFVFTRDTEAVRGVCTLDFGMLRSETSSLPVWGLLSTTTVGALEREHRGTASSAGGGNGARCGTTTAVVTRGTNGHLYFTYRTNGATTVTTVDLASDAYSPADVGDSPCICASHDATNFWIAYRTTTTDVVKVLNVSITGTVNATYTSAAITDMYGIWIDNTPVATNRVMLAVTHTAGLTLRTLNATTMADIGADSTYAHAAGSDGKSVVVGCADGTTAWWAFITKVNAGASGDALVLGRCTVGSAASATAVRVFLSGTVQNDASITWAICHQPIKLDGRMYITVTAAAGVQRTSTWLTIDLTNLYNSASGTGPFNAPSLVARGPSQATYPSAQPSTAILTADSTGFVFPTVDWGEFGQALRPTHDIPDTVGSAAHFGLNRLSFSGPRALDAGPVTVFTGSVPHMVAAGDCVELGFPFLAGQPGIVTSAETGGTIPAGTYGVQACWRWTDPAGNVHRGAASGISTVTITAGSGNYTIRVLVTNPWISSKWTDSKIEVYITAVNPTEGASHFLQSTSAPLYTDGYTAIDHDGSPALLATSAPIYTDGSVLNNFPVRADGGGCVVGRRLYLADEHTVYASKYLSPGTGPEFNDEGTHQIALPVGAGRIIALEPLDDKVVVFCERGAFFIQDGGPDNTGLGADFAPPVRLHDLPIAGPRSSCSTDAGILFCTTLDAVDPARGGPWLLDRQLTLTERQYLGRPALDYFQRTSSWVPEVVYSPERQQAYFTTLIAGGTSYNVVVFDMRVGKWATWDTNTASYGSVRSVATVGGILWVLNNEPAPYSASPGYDDLAGVATSYSMSLTTAQLFADGRDGAGWSRVRSLRAIGAESAGTHDLTMTAVMDGTRSFTTGAFSVAAQSADTTWPGTRQAPEWRLPTQKCATIKITLSAAPALARWSAIRLDVAPLATSSPARSRR